MYRREQETIRRGVGCLALVPTPVAIIAGAVSLLTETSFIGGLFVTVALATVSVLCAGAVLCGIALLSDEEGVS